MKKLTIYRIRALIFTLLFAPFWVANCTAITLDEIDLMLRSGFSSETIIREELIPGRVYGTFDAKREEDFKLLHASPALIELLKSGKYSASEEETRDFNQRQLTIAETEKRAALQREREQIEQTKIARRAAQTYAANHQQAAAQADAKLNARVAQVLSSPMGYGIMSPDQQRVYDRAQAVVNEKLPEPRPGDLIGDKSAMAELGRNREQLFKQLMSDETFIRDTLR